MLLLELLENVHLLLFVRRRQALLLLTLVKHHLLDHAASRAVKVGELGVLRLDLGNIDLGRRRDNMCPPLDLVDLVQMDFNRLHIGGIVRRQRPCRVVNVHGVGEVALESG